MKMKAGFFGGKEDETLHRRSGWTGLTLHQEVLLISAYLDNMGEDED